MTTVDWYFDFISPYAYFGLPLLKGLPAEADLRYQPILLAGLLNHWGQKGPAEIPPKRTWTYRACVWWAKQHDVPFQMPAVHPFNPLPYLRLCIAAGNTRSAIQTIFEALWTTGANPADPGTLAALVAQLGVPRERLEDSHVKDTLRQNTAGAVERGVFGVPTLFLQGQVFWGSDAVDFAAAFLADPKLFETAPFRRADTLPIGVTRKV
jgi:2-hydroxychromene-2-carboxylate isomerase